MGNTLAESRTRIGAIGGSGTNGYVGFNIPRYQRIPNGGNCPREEEEGCLDGNLPRGTHQRYKRLPVLSDRGKLSRHHSRSSYFTRTLRFSR